MKCFKVLMVALDREASERKDPAAKAYLAKISTVNFIATLLMLYDLLPHLSRLSKVFQKSSLNFSELQSALDTAITSVEQLQNRPGPNEIQLEDFLVSINFKVSNLPAKLEMW